MSQLLRNIRRRSRLVRSLRLLDAIDLSCDIGDVRESGEGGERDAPRQVSLRTLFLILPFRNAIFSAPFAASTYQIQPHQHLATKEERRGGLTRGLKALPSINSAANLNASRFLRSVWETVLRSTLTKG